MSPKLPVVRPEDVVGALEKAGWKVHRRRGSHVSMHKEGVAYVITVPLHRRDMPKGTLRGIIKDAGLTLEEFVELL
jgi:predicted RNA binding protein YcfA (HicA-like mRNA interferase family)